MNRVRTVGDLIEGGIRTTRQCDWCRDVAEVDLHRIAAAKGADFSLVDRLPICTNGGCFGMVRFQMHRGMRTAWLMTAEGEARFQKHCDWIAQYHVVLVRREHQLAVRKAEAPRNSPTPQRRRDV